MGVDRSKSRSLAMVFVIVKVPQVSDFRPMSLLFTFSFLKSKVIPNVREETQASTSKC